MEVSIIIPVLNEAENIQRLVNRLFSFGQDLVKEIIVVDHASTDGTLDLAKAAGAIPLLSPKKGRGPQMNYGAQHASAPLLYFVHGDTLPPECYMQEIQKAIQEDFPIGCFRFKFDSPRPLLAINSYFTRFDRLWCRGGDQSLFIKRTLFDQLNGFRDDFIIMEDYDIIVRARQNNPFKIIQKDVLISARKFDTNPYLWVQICNLIVFTMYRRSYSQEQMYNTYNKLLNYRNEKKS
jgi:rSAM/selenodomain-associated transferase 2